MIGIVIDNLPTKKTPDHMVLLVNSIKYLRGKKKRILFKSFQKIEEQGTFIL